MARGFDYETTLGACWSKMENDFKIYYPRKSDGWLMHNLMTEQVFKEFISELEDRGYDTKTLRISVKRK
jgi:hypothetical protein